MLIELGQGGCDGGAAVVLREPVGFAKQPPAERRLLPGPGGGEASAQRLLLRCHGIGLAEGSGDGPHIVAAQWFDACERGDRVIPPAGTPAVARQREGVIGPHRAEFPVRQVIREEEGRESMPNPQPGDCNPDSMIGPTMPRSGITAARVTVAQPR